MTSHGTTMIEYSRDLYPLVHAAVSRDFRNVPQHPLQAAYYLIHCYGLGNLVSSSTLNAPFSDSHEAIVKQYTAKRSKMLGRCDDRRR